MPTKYTNDQVLHHLKAKHIVLIPCAGSGSRFGATIPKQYLEVLGKTILAHTLDIFTSIDAIDEIVLVAQRGDTHIDFYEKISDKIQVLKVGGDTRGASVLNALNELPCAANDWILVHDAVRCCTPREAVRRLMHELNQDLVGGILALNATDTIKEVMDGLVQKTLDRRHIYLAQTPQMFRYGVLREAYAQADLSTVTDEASAVEASGKQIRIIAGAATNIKITYPHDLQMAEFLLSKIEL